MEAFFPDFINQKTKLNRTMLMKKISPAAFFRPLRTTKKYRMLTKLKLLEPEYLLESTIKLSFIGALFFRSA